jgi:NADPH2:quinone reductase
MKAAYITQTGPPENIVYGELPIPVPTGSQALVRVSAVSLNPVDTYIRGGAVKMNLPFPFVVGCDLAGVVEAVGPQAIRFQPGDRVWGSNQGLLGRQGTFAEYAAVEDCWLYSVPAAIGFEEAAAISLVGITAHLGLFRDAKLQAGETILVQGASGAVGSTVMQMAKATGARVIATTSSPEKAEFCRALGADHVLDYRRQPVDVALKALSPGGVNVWWETSREPNFDLAVACLAARGRMVVMAGRDARPQFPVGPFYVKGCRLNGFVMFQATPDEQRLCAEAINRWLVEGQLKPRIDRLMPLSETAAAHRLQEENTLGRAGTMVGKIVLRP